MMAGDMKSNQMGFSRWLGGRVCRSALVVAAVAGMCGELPAASEDAWEEFRADVARKMERAVAGRFGSHTVHVEPWGSESYGVAIATGSSAEDKSPLTVIGIYRKETGALEIIEMPGTRLEKESEAAGEAGSAGAESKKGAGAVAALLQGKWRHVEDKKNLLIFEGDVRRESGDGGKTWEETTFVLDSRCRDAGDEAAGQAGDYYITAGDGLCWHVDAVSRKALSLTYMGRGNSLNYVRVKK